MIKVVQLIEVLKLELDQKNKDVLLFEKDTSQRLAQQREIFADALRFVKPGGTIVYATCSILDEENIDQVKYFCAAHGIYLTTEPVHALPQSRSLDGFFCACLHYG